MAVGDYTYDEDEEKLRINYLGSIFGASIEDFADCMADVLDKVLEVKHPNSVVLVKDREYEYGPEQTKMLVEIAKIIEDVVRERLVSTLQAKDNLQRKMFPEINARIQNVVLNTLRRDPIGAYVEIIREIRRVRINMRNTRHKSVHDFYGAYLKNVLNVIKAKMEKTQLIELAKPHIAGYHIGDRSLYREIFVPSVRPNFMLTRYMITPPENGKSVKRYNVGDIEVEVFKLPDKTEYFYYVLPPEFILSEEKYAVLDAARRYMATHRPKEAEFVKTGRIREVFYNIGRDMIREVADQQKVHLTNKDLDQLAVILTRYTAGLGVLELLLADENIQDIYVNSPVESQPILINHSEFEECRTNLIPTQQDAESWATRMRMESGRPLDEANPVLDTDILVPGGRARFCIITKTLSPKGLGFSIRRHRDRPWTLPLFMKAKMLTPLASGVLSFLIDGTASMLVAGGRGSGKTSMLAAMMLELLPKTRIVSIQDTLELPIEQLMDLGYNIESLKSRSVMTMVETEIPADEALRTALRLGDSALVVGEVRSTEAKSLYEAMRIGALSNVVMGTIHGESAYGVFDRVVNDLEVPLTSFKATDIVPICKTLRSADGLHRFRRMTEITEVRKKWEKNPDKEGGFVNLFEYSAKEDTIKPTDTLVNGESETLNRIASHVREWHGDWQSVWENINLRANIKKTIVEMSDKLKNPNLLEAEWVMRSNSHFHIISEAARKEVGSVESKRVYDEWLRWLKAAIR
ncbi:MAG: type II/IV secretion system ATPase subunit [Candidatus Aenigmatarchaeota archaeon]|nr:MAG: type II/IV secretion system ATPase subunit [Candidatus Aenigmarchaeota archaeon]